jgi:aspartyl-tRNA synthetase
VWALIKSRRRKRQDFIEWRRNKVIEQTIKGHTQFEIAEKLQVGIGTVNRDIAFFKAQVKESSAKFIEIIQQEHEKSMIGLNAVLKEAWIVSENSKDNREKLQALSLAKDCYALLEEFLCNEPIIDQALKFESENKRDFSRIISNSGLDCEPNWNSEGHGNAKGDSGSDIQGPEEKVREGE